MATQLNVFRTVPYDLSTSLTTVYTAPTGYAAVVLLAQVSNIGASTITVDAYHVRSATTTSIIKGASIPTNDALNLLTGRLILQSGDSIELLVSANSSAQLLLSVLETAT
jgi:hypothetical protein